MPWLGYIARLVEADTFVYLDHVQLTERGWQSRNRILGPDGPRYLSVPVRRSGHFGQRIVDAVIDDTHGWRERHLRSIALAYAKAPFIDAVVETILAPVLTNRDYSRLSDLNRAVVASAMSYVSMPTTVVLSSELAPAGHATDMLIDLAHRLHADELIVGGGARSYLGALPKTIEGVRIRESRFVHPTYPQGSDLPFSHGLSFVDLFVRVSPRTVREILARSVSTPSPDHSVGA